MSYFSVAQAAVVLHLHPETIRQACRDRRLDFKRSGNKYLFTDEHLNAFVDKFGSIAARRKAASRTADILTGRH